MGFASPVHTVPLQRITWDALPRPAWSFPTRDEMADYLAAYAARFQLPVRSGVHVDRLSRDGRGFVVRAGERRFDAERVVVAMANYQRPRIPRFAHELDPSIVQLHSGEYRNPSQLREGGVLLVGAGNSGAEIALEVVRSHPTWLSGRNTGHVPVRIEGLASRLIFSRIALRLFFHRILTVRTPLGRKLWRKARSKGQPLIRVKPKDLAAAGVVRVTRTTGVRHGLPVLEDGSVLDVTNVVWCTGFHPDFSWIDLPVFEDGEPLHERGIVTTEPGLYFVGLHFLYAVSSAMVQGVGRDARRIARHISNSPTHPYETTRKNRRPPRPERCTDASESASSAGMRLAIGLRGSQIGPAAIVRETVSAREEVREAVARMARIGVRSCSLDRRFSPDSAQPDDFLEQGRTVANAAQSRQGGGHWFEPSTATRPRTASRAWRCFSWGS